MSKGFRGLTYAALSVAGLFLMSAAPASAICYDTAFFSTGTVVGTGLSCTAAHQDLLGNLQATANNYCQAHYGADAQYNDSTYSFTANGCEVNGVGYRESGSASFQCHVCVP
jgi:hypothetical protein